MSKKITTLKSLRLSFALATVVGAGGALYHLDSSHPHGVANPYHDTYDTVYENGKATEAQKETLVEAAIESGQDAAKSNYYAIGGGIGYLGVWLTSGLIAGRRPSWGSSKKSGPKA
jgi:hypothetical protein